MKRKLLFTFLTVFLAFLCLAMPAFAASGDESHIYDGADLLTVAEEGALLDAIAQAEAKADVDFFVYTGVPSTSDGEREDKVTEAFGYGETYDSVILVIEKSTSGRINYYLITYGEGYSLLSDSDCDRILDAPTVYNSLKSGEFSAGATSFLDISSSTVAENRISRENTGRLLRIAVPIVLALLAAGITVGVVIYKYKRKLKSPIYPLSKYASLELTHSSDNYVTSHVTKVRVQSSSSGGRSGGGRSGGSRGGR